MSNSFPSSKTSTIPTGFLRNAKDGWAIAFGHLAMVPVGFLTSCLQDSRALTRVVILGEPGPRDVYHLVTYGILGFAVAFLAVYTAAWWAVRRAGLQFRAALASFCRLLWPAVAGLLVLPALWVEIEHKDFFGLILLPAMTLIVIFFTWRILELKRDRPKESANHETSFRRWGYAVLAVAVVYFAWFGFLSIRQHLVINTGLHDLGIYEQMMWNTINGRPFECAMLRLEWVGYELHKFDNHFFAEHFIPTYIITAPFYWLFPSAWTLLIMQTFLLAAMAVPAYLIAWKKLGHPPLAFLFVFALLVHPLVQEANLDDVHVDAYAPVFLLGAFAACLYRRTVLYWALLVMALGCKQEIALIVMLMGIFLFFSEKDRRKLAGATIILGAVWFLLTVQVIIPWFRGGLPLRQFERYGHFIPGWHPGSDVIPTPGLVLRGMMADPANALEIILSPARFRSLLLLLAPFGMLTIFNRWIWVWLLPLAAMHLLSSQIEQYEFRAYYGITLVPVAFIGAVYGMYWLLRRDRQPEEPSPRHRLVAAIAGMVFLVAFTWDGYGFTPRGGRFSSDHYRKIPREDMMYKYLATIPPDAVVTTQTRLGAQLAQRRYIYNIPEVVEEGEGRTMYLFLDTRGPTWPLYRERADYQDFVRHYVASEQWGLILPPEDGLLLFKRGHPPDEYPVDFDGLEFTRYRRGR